MNTSQEVKVWEEEVIIPTYEVGQAEKNPIFLENRVYQGSSGKVYPYPIIETISDKKTDKVYKALYMENQYLKIMILPELGGRIQRAYDKTNGYDFVYYNQVIKPALVGLVGPWISGGIEFNWPQHHRPTTFMPVDYVLQDNDDGSKTVFVNDVDQMYGTKGMAAFTLYSDSAYLEIRGQLYNRTPLPQTFLWWANPAVAVNEHTQSIFPPDVHAVMDHGKRDVSRFPIATGVYYKKDYSEGVDISRYKNIPVPTSYMAEKSEYDFVGGYDHNLGAGILHVANHHISPGKKQWTWGCGDFGKAWDRNLTDEDGPYIELMTGVYTDNQPDFSWLKPFEAKVFKQYFMPYKGIGRVKNATINGALNLEVSVKEASIKVYTTKEYKNALVCMYQNDKLIFEETVTISPILIYEKVIAGEFRKASQVSVVVSQSGETIVDYTPVEQTLQKLPSPAKPAKAPKDIRTNEELYLTGLHLEQYRHATFSPDEYYLEGLSRDEEDVRINNAYGSLLLRRGMFKDCEKHFRKAIKRLTALNPNPYDCEAYYNLGLSLFYQDKKKKAYDAFYKATWNSGQQEMAFYYLAAIEACNGNYESALELIEKALIKNSHNVKARGLKAAILRKLGLLDKAKEMIRKNLCIDPFDYVSLYESALLNQENKIEYLNKMNSIMRQFHENYLQAARDYSEAGFLQEAIDILKECKQKNVMLKYYEAYYYGELKAMDLEAKALKEAACGYPDYCFPNKLEDITVLKNANYKNPSDAFAYYYLGNLYYDKRQYTIAINFWEKSRELNESFPTVHRNLSLAYYNKLGEYDKARGEMEKAFDLNTSDARLFLELDQLYKKVGMTACERLENFNRYKGIFIQRDDLYIEYITLLNLLGRHEEALLLIEKKIFHPWEGGEGKITTQYTLSLLELAKIAINNQEYKKAQEYLTRALTYPENLGEGKLEGTKNNHIYYYLGLVYENLALEEEAIKCYRLASIGDEEPAGMMYYNDQPADMILYQGLAKLKLGEKSQANARFYKLLDYGEQHIFDEIRIEYFAVSLPDLLIFHDDLNIRNKVHCYFLIGLANVGLGKNTEAIEAFHKALDLDKNHIGCIQQLKGVGDAK